MKKNLLAFLMVIMMIFKGFCQTYTDSLINITDSIKVKRNSILVKNNLLTKNADIEKVFSQVDSPEITQHFKAFKSKKAISNVVGIIGALGVGWSLGNLISNSEKKSHENIANIGAGLTLVSAVINIAANKSLKKAAGLYNLKFANKVSFKTQFEKQSKEITFAINF